MKSYLSPPLFSLQKGSIKLEGTLKKKKKTIKVSNITNVSLSPDQFVPFANDYTWNQIDKSVSSLSGLSDVDGGTVSLQEVMDITLPRG